MKRNGRVLILTIFLAGFQVPELFAAQTGDSIDISFTGHLMGRKACTVNNNQVINVVFGTVAVNKVATGTITQPINYSLNCSGATESNSVEMTIKATPVAGHSATMAASQPGLWVTFLNEGLEQTLNTPFSVADWHNPPKLDIRLDQDPDSELQAATFTATATLMAEYF
ncbi:fimbrial protein [Citrobacter amalonaticus]|nr:fimbrial protein [Citrobacter amalonaticus]MDE5204580.1 fimbrial protein [Citrobacter amalonaticus]